MSNMSDDEFIPEYFNEEDRSDTKKKYKTKSDSEYRIKARGHGTEAKKVNARLNGYDSENSHAWQMIKNRFSSGITHAELKSVANIISMKINIKVDREAVRDNRVLIKWFDENWEKIETIFDQINIHDFDGKIISSSREKEIESFSRL